jgi:hypothetical protein
MSVARSSRWVTLEEVKQLIGHSSITLTSNTYGHVLEQRQREVAEAMDVVLGRGEPDIARLARSSHGSGNEHRRLSRWLHSPKAAGGSPVWGSSRI